MSNRQPPESPPPEGPRSPQSFWDPSGLGPEDRVRILEEHFSRYGQAYTPGALGRVALEAGYTEQEIAAAIAKVQVSSAASAEASAPTRATAQRVILASYGLTYLVFAIVFLSQPSSYGIGVIALMILTFTLSVALGLSALWARRRRFRDQGSSLKLASILSVPIILLVLVAGTCAVTTFPAIGH
jgi:hypothetical protein